MTLRTKEYLATHFISPHRFCYCDVSVSRWNFSFASCGVFDLLRLPCSVSKSKTTRDIKLLNNYHPQDTRPLETSVLCVVSSIASRPWRIEVCLFQLLPFIIFPTPTSLMPCLGKRVNNNLSCIKK